MRADPERERGRDRGGGHGARGGPRRLLPARAALLQARDLPQEAGLPALPHAHHHQRHREVLPRIQVR